MKEVDEMKKVIAEHKQQRLDAQRRIILARESVDRTRKAKRDEQNRPH
ncbi:hypothetical protein LCGC14_1485620 [marine sediment metagenome]|uniref:Uncharacterized protein n=1 Tax=marine sediment metagenome TaxID=412755 RepID=A0A0F9LNU2_9ZZZZ